MLPVVPIQYWLMLGQFVHSRCIRLMRPNVPIILCSVAATVEFVPNQSMGLKKGNLKFEETCNAFANAAYTPELQSVHLFRLSIAHGLALVAIVLAVFATPVVPIVRATFAFPSQSTLVRTEICHRCYPVKEPIKQEKRAEYRMCLMDDFPIKIKIDFPLTFGDFFGVKLVAGIKSR